MEFEAEYRSLILDIEKQFEGFDLADTDSNLETTSQYVRHHRHEYLRTIQDIDSFFEKSRDQRIFEIGAFFGVVSIALSRLGYDVTASDVHDYISLDAQKERFSREGVSTHSMNLQDFELDLPDASVDCVVMCEVLEHLNFNPLPLLKEINRILRKGGLFYVALPNGAQIRNRLNLLMGKPVGLSVQGFFDQLDTKSAVIANGHWREYTMEEVREMLEPLGFRRHRSYFFSLSETGTSKSMRKKVGRAFYRLFPYFKENQTNLYVKEQSTLLEFDIPNTVHQHLNKL